MLRLTLVMVMLCVVSYGQNSNANFRDVSWGMSKAEVKQSEEKDLAYKNDIDESKEQLVYSAKPLGLNAKIFYRFTNNKLTLASYIFTERYSKPEEYISDYKEVKRLLKRKYGNPVQEGKNWKNDLYRDNQAKWSKALSLSHLEYRCSFYTKKTRIVAQLQQSDQMGIMHSITYGSLKYRDEEKKKKDEKNLDDL